MWRITIGIALAFLLLGNVAGLSPDDLFSYAGSCESPGELCVISRTDNPLPIAEFPQYISNSLAFVALGDWGCGLNNCQPLHEDVNHASAGRTQKSVADGMGDAAQVINSRFVLALGDNFYWQGVTSVDDPLWRTVWQDRFTHPALSTPWYVLMGNHDHYGNAQAQIDFGRSGKDPRWILPNYYWTTSHVVGNRRVQIIMIDTVILDEAITREMLLEKISSGHVHEQALQQFDASRSIRARAAEDQLDWLDQTLQASTADWLFVAGHYPVFSGGEHGNTASLLQYVKPMLDRYRVDAYFSGHDHTLQHLKSGHVNYYVCGNGSLRGAVRALPQTLFAAVDPGFTTHQVTEDYFVTTMIDHTGRPLYSSTLKRARTS